jgi:3',5'-cyclic AMP phosphodiesterase CpdA
MSERFIVLTDTHFLAPGHRVESKTWWNRVLEARCSEISAALVEAVQRLAPDFIIHCGDFTGHGDMVNYEFGLDVMNRLGCPWYAVPGNHDTWFPGVRAALAARYQLPGEACSYARDLAGLRFIFLDVAYWTSKHGEISPYLDKTLYDQGQIAGMGPSPEALAWLERELAAADRPVVLVSHAPLGYRPAYPVVTLPHGKPIVQPQTSVVDLIGDVLHRQTVRALLRRCPQVKAAFAGHWHICDTFREDGLTFCQTGALREYPFEFRLVEVQDGALRVSTVGIGADFQTESYVEAWGNRWVAGTEADRSFSIELK